MSSSKKKPPLISRIFFSEPCLKVSGLILRAFLSLIYCTLRVEIKNEKVLFSSKRRIVALWHDQLIFAPLIRRVLRKDPLAIVVSKSRDGRLLAAFVNTFKNTKTILVAHNMRHKALLQMVEAVKTGHTILITPDGPRGPRHKIKPGITYTADEAEADIFAMRAQPTSFWQLNTWDKMLIPKPFSKVSITFEACQEDLQEKLALEE